MFLAHHVRLSVCDIAASSVSSHRSRSDKLPSSLFRNTSLRDIPSSSLPCDVPVDSAVSRPFKPVGHNPQQYTMLDSSVCVSDGDSAQTVSSECPLVPMHPAADSSAPSSPRSPQGSECLLPTCMQVSPKCSLDTPSSEHPLPSMQEYPLLSAQEYPLPSMHGLSDDSGSEEDPTIESKHRDNRLHSPVSQPVEQVVSATTASEMSAAARISMALSRPDSVPKSQTDPDAGHRDMSSLRCSYVAPTTKISMAVSAQTSKIGQRLSSMLHNRRLRQHSSSLGISYRIYHGSLCLFLN